MPTAPTACPGSRIQEHASACAKIGAKPDMEAYLSGRIEGLVSYCQPAERV